MFTKYLVSRKRIDNHQKRWGQTLRKRINTQIYSIKANKEGYRFLKEKES